MKSLLRYFVFVGAAGAALFLGGCNYNDDYPAIEVKRLRDELAAMRFRRVRKARLRKENGREIAEVRVQVGERR